MAERKRRDARVADRLSLHPLTLDEALKGAMETGTARPGPKRKRDQEKKEPPQKRGRKAKA